MQIFAFFHNLAILLFTEISILSDNKTLCCPIWSVIILMMNESDSCCAVA